jgi:hypothetical protein
MKLLSFIFICLTSIFLTGCAKAPGGPYIIPIIGYLITAGLLVMAYLSSKSNSDQQTPNGIKDNTGNVPFYKTWPFYWAAGLLVLTIIANLVIYSNYRLYDPKKHGVGKEAPKDNRESAEEQARKADSIYNLKK